MHGLFDLKTSYVQKKPAEVFCKMDVLRNFAKFTGKGLCQSLFFNKVGGLRTLLNTYRTPPDDCFSKSFQN